MDVSATTSIYGRVKPPAPEQAPPDGADIYLPQATMDSNVTSMLPRVALE